MSDEAAPRPVGAPVPGDALRERSVLIGLCYRLLGSLTDAEDAVQETYVRWCRLGEQERLAIAHPRAWLIKTASRIGLDMLKSARARRERYVGEWLPEPIPAACGWKAPAATTLDPAERAIAGESVSMALLIVFESMTPAERVAFVLHDVFRYTFPEVADILGRTPAACRQLASSGRRRVRAARRTRVSPERHAAVVRSFKHAWETGDIDGLVALLDPAAIAITDGGGRVSSSVEPLVGAEAVARFFVGVHRRQDDLTVREDYVNGELGLVATGDGETRAVITMSQTDGRVGHIWAVRNPEKLTAWKMPAFPGRTTGAPGDSVRSPSWSSSSEA